MRIQLTWVIGALLTPFLMSCDGPGTSEILQITVPNNFKGAIELTEDKQNGVPVIAKPGLISIEVNNTGKIKLKSTSQLYKWHILRFVTDTGITLAMHSSDTSASSPDKTIYAFSFGTHTRTNQPTKLLYFIGTIAEAEAYAQSLRP